jgi:hypothetical protein
MYPSKTHGAATSNALIQPVCSGLPFAKSRTAVPGKSTHARHYSTASRHEKPLHLVFGISTSDVMNLHFNGAPFLQ